MKKLILLTICLFASLVAFCAIDTTALHAVVSGIPVAEKYWPIAAKIFGGITSVCLLISELLPFLPTKANGLVHGLFTILGIIKPKDVTGTVPAGQPNKSV